jgi:hypothetical protein
MAAAKLSKWDIPKIYWNVMPKSVIQDGIDKMKALGSDFMGAESADDLPFAKDDSFVHALIDGADFVEQKMEEDLEQSSVRAQQIDTGVNRKLQLTVKQNMNKSERKAEEKRRKRARRR